MTLLNDYKPPLEDFIQHHGVKGQKWGVRREEGGSGSSLSTKLKSVKLTDTQKKVIVAGVVTAGAVAAAVVLKNSGGVSVSQINSSNVVAKATEASNKRSLDRASKTISRATAAANISSKKVNSARQTAEFIGKRRDQIGRTIDGASKSGNNLNSPYMQSLFKQHGDLGTKLISAPYADRGQRRTLRKLGI